jgi:hypothetical protein
VVRRRQRYYVPVAALLAVGLGFGLYEFVTFEQTAITTIPRGETVPVFVPFTPTPSPVPSPSPTPLPGQVVRANTWEGRYQQLFAERCGSCHVQTSLGGLGLGSYEQALSGGQSGPAILPGDPDASLLVQVQSTGGHPGQLTIDEVGQVIDWIKAGAPER